MKAALLADIHGNDAALRAVSDALKNAGIRRVLMLGDLCGYFPFVESCCDLLADFDVTAVMGNHDEIALRCMETCSLPDEAYESRYGNALARMLKEISPRTEQFLRTLPLSQEIFVGTRRVIMHHGSPQDSLHGRIYPDHADWSPLEACTADLLALGHTHYPLLKALPHTLVVNPGSVGQPRHRKGAWAAFAIYDADAHAVQLCEVGYDVSRIVADCLERQPERASILKRFLSS
ncbi:MAG: metallophosphoesterase family protein [Prosthecobacter sp.]|nr:metallophosphoesterase family protein [Prosthecobacter sp.]